MARKLATLTAAVLLLAPAASRAQVLLGARLGYAFGGGDVGNFSSGSIHMSDWTKSQVPVQFDLLFKVAPSLAIGPYASLAWAQPGGDLQDLCDSAGMDCNATIMRLGVEAMFTVPQPGPFKPWFGAGLGYEWSKVHTTGGGASGDRTLGGFEFLNLQAGGDLKIAPLFRIGPFVQLSLAQYSSVDSSGGWGDLNHIPSKKVHEWFQIGVRGMFDL